MSTKTKEYLQNIMKVEGVRAVVLLTRDGFIIDNIAGENIDPEAIGAVISTSTGTTEVMGKNLALGTFKQSMEEFDQGVILVTLASDLILSVIADTRVNLGALRYTVKKIAPEISQAF